MECRAGTFSVAEACLLLPQHRQLGGHDLGSEFVTTSLPQLVHTFARQVLNKNSDITEDNDVRQDTFKFEKTHGGTGLETSNQ